ncbi:MAG: SdrD B-like domain-containing protein [Candidatus Bathyarchaeia archaeon]
MKGKIGLLVLAILVVFSMLAVFPIPVRAELNIVFVKSSGSVYPPEKNIFLTNENVYCVIKTTGIGSKTVRIYVTYNDAWKDGQNPPSLNDVSGGHEEITITATESPQIHGPFLIWSAPTTLGQYDIVVDEDCDGVRDPGEKVDNSEADPGFIIQETPTSPAEVPSISIVKSANVSMAHVGDGIKYTYKVSNTGNVPLSNVYVEDSLGITVNYVGGDMDEDNFLDTDETWIFEAEYVVPEDAPDELPNTATAHGTYGTTTVSATDSWTVTILKPDISVEKSGPEYAHEGDKITYTITVKNTGNCELTDVTVIDDVLGDLTSYLPDTTLKLNEENTITVTYTVPQPSDDITNTVTASGKDALDKKDTASASWTVDILHPAISVTKTADKTKVYAGETITYTIVVTNTGDCPLYNVNVTDTLRGTLLTSEFLDVGDSKTFTVTYTVEAGDSDPLVNTVTVEGKDVLGLVVSDEDSAEVDLIAKICGYKFHDVNGNGVWDEGELGLEGWTIELWLSEEKIGETTTDSSGFYCFDNLDAGEYIVKEASKAYWKSTTGSTLTVTLMSGEISEGNNFGNTKLVTRTQGFWATHPSFMWKTWEYVDDKTIGTKTIDTQEKLLGAFWSSIPYTSTGTRRSLLDQARMQLLQQLVAAILNVQAFGDDDLGTGANLIDEGKAAFTSNNRAWILSVTKALEEFNSSGDALPLPEGVYPGPADPKTAQKIANKGFWDTLP